MKILFYAICLCLALSIGFSSGAEAFKMEQLDEINKLANEGDAEAQTKLGVIYARGLVDKVAVDKKKAADWYTKAADQGYKTAQWNLGFMYIRGEGVEMNEKKARELFLKAAEQGFAPAEYDLAMMHLYGMGGKRSRSEALKWAHRAADQGYKEAIGFLSSQGEYEKDEDPKLEKNGQSSM